LPETELNESNGQKEDTDNEQENADEPPIVEDLNDIGDCATIEVINDWDKRFLRANYTEEQRRVVHKSVEKMREYFDLLKATDWNRQQDKEGMTVDQRMSPRQLNSFKATRTIPQNNLDIFATLCASPYRNLYDDAIDKTDNLKRICANVKVIYQKSKKIAGGMVSARDFVIIQYNHIHENGDITIIVYTDEAYENLMPEQKGVTRAALELGGWHLEKINDKSTRATLYVEPILRGSIPMWVQKNTNVI